MHFAIRVDASDQIGTGHLMRCLTLADALRVRGAEVHFVSRHMPLHLQQMLRDHGHQFTLLAESNEGLTDELAHARWLGTSQTIDAQATRAALAGRKWDWLIVDHYALDARWESELRLSCRKIMVIDDLADRMHDCDVLMDQNIYSDMHSRYVGKVPPHCRQLMGPRYALLRPDFALTRQRSMPRDGDVRRILVFFGGVDAANYTGRAIAGLAALQNTALQVDVVIGAVHPKREQLLKDCAAYGYVCHVQTDRMAELMADADLSIGAGGGATWERCCLGLPTLVLSTAYNQKRQLVDAARAGLVYAPDVDDDIESAVARHMMVLIENPSLRTLISGNGMHAVDARGASRIVHALGSSSIEMRAVTINDSRDLFNWRNDPTIRTVSRNTELIAWDGHQHWLDAVLADPNRILLIGMTQNMPAGVVRYDLDGESAEISIYLVPDKLSSGLGAELLLAAETWLMEKLPKIRSIHAHVLGGNERSMRLFASAGYTTELTRFTKRLKQDE